MKYVIAAIALSAAALVHADGFKGPGDQPRPSTAAEASMAVWDIFRRNRKVGYWDDLDAQRRTMNEIDDYLYDEVKGKRQIALTTAEMDEIIARTMQLARHRMEV